MELHLKPMQMIFSSFQSVRKECCNQKKCEMLKIGKNAHSLFPLSDESSGDTVQLD
jgi:hypothetical protein